MSENREITIYDIAKYLKISATTVSRGLKNHPTINKHTRKKIAEAASLLGYRTNHFASSLRTNKTMTLGVLIPRINSYFMSSALEGMQAAADSHGYTLIIAHANEKAEKEAANAAMIFNKRVDGLLLSPAYDTKSIEHLTPFFKKNIPVVFFDRSWPHPDCAVVEIDNFKAAYDITKHLLDQGFRRIMHITGSLERNVYADRLNGYKAALRDHRITVDDKKVIVTPLTADAGKKIAETIIAMKAKERPDAIFASNDITAAYCMTSLRDAGIRIPADIGFAGFNNDPFSEIAFPPLTTCNYPGFRIGETAVNLIIRHLNGAGDLKTTPRIILRSELIIRASSLKK